MRTTKSVSLFALLAALGAGVVACNDTGDNSSSPDSGADGTMTGDDSSVGTDTGNVGDTGNAVDSTMPGEDSAAPEASADTGSAGDTGSMDSSEVDSTVETGAPESGTDTGTQDAPGDTGTDVTSAETGTPDTGTADTGTPDTGTPDTGTDSSTTPILDAHCATNNGGAGCTPTELLLIGKDTNADGSGKGSNAAYGCYDCLVAQGCLDDKLIASDVDHECGDTTGSGITQPTLSGDPAATSCLKVVSCVLGGNCATTLGAGTCYCGTAVGSNCTIAGDPNGPCLTQEQDGTDSNAPATVNNRYTDITYAAGMANTIFSCAASNSCTQCYP